MCEARLLFEHRKAWAIAPTPASRQVRYEEGGLTSGWPRNAMGGRFPSHRHGRDADGGWSVPGDRLRHTADHIRRPPRDTGSLAE